MKVGHMFDPTEDTRREMVKELNANPGSREYLETRHDQVWDTAEMQKEFHVNSFMAPFVVVTRKSDGVKGTLQFQHRPRFYYGFVAG